MCSILCIHKKKMVNAFWLGLEGLDDEHCLPRPITVPTNENEANRHDMILTDKQLSMSYTAEKMGISDEQAH